MLDIKNHNKPSTSGKGDHGKASVRLKGQNGDLHLAMVTTLAQGLEQRLGVGQGNKKLV